MTSNFRTDTDGNTRTFDEWKKEVDKILVKLVQIKSDDLADYTAWDTWDSETPPAGGAVTCLQQQDFFSEEQLADMFDRIGVDAYDYM